MSAPPAPALSAETDREQLSEAPNPPHQVDPEDPDSLLAALEAETAEEEENTITHNLRESRAQKLAEELRAARQYTHLVSAAIHALGSDDQLLKFTTQNDRCLVHFSHPDFARCAVMDTHLRRLAGRHGGGAAAADTTTTTAGVGEDVRFARVDVRDAPFVVEKLGIRVLPCLVGFRDGVAVGRMVGFEGVVLGLAVGRKGEDEESGTEVTRGIERVVVGWKVFDRVTKGWQRVGGGGSSEEEDDDDQDEDWEEEEKKRRRKKAGGLSFGNGSRGIQGKKKNGVADDDDDDDDWD